MPEDLRTGCVHACSCSTIILVRRRASASSHRHTLLKQCLYRLGRYAVPFIYSVPSLPKQEFNYAAVLGLGAAVDYALAIGLEKIAARVRCKSLLDLVLR